ncbi:MAG: MBL fold metallo-hydrolase [Sporomusaceae bacterium]|nr:MBL fold metallo-hydrolase [Sporomusaceae bacterium]
MNVHVLASGSSGNSACLQFGDTNILVDAGISARRIKNGLDAAGIAVESLSAVLVTHEHTDHISGLAMLTKKYRLPVYSRPDTFAAMSCRDLLPPECCRELPDSLDIGKVRVEPFSILHDAADPVGFNFFSGRTKCSFATDIGFVTGGVKARLENSDVLVLEANHDVNMLQSGAYPWYLKKRILGNRGHLSNNDCGWTLARMARKQHADVFLAHISKENNRPEVAEETVSRILEEDGLNLEEDITLHLTYPDRMVSLNYTQQGED